MSNPQQLTPQQRAAQLRHTAQELHNQYEAGFAGQPRVSRNPGLLDEWATRLKGLRGSLQGLPKGLHDELSALLSERVDLYTRESEAIRVLQSLGAPSQRAYGVIEWVGLIDERYQRHFAGFSRNTRDLNMLSELILDSSELHAQTEALLSGVGGALEGPASEDLAAQRKRLEENIALYESERAAISAARLEGKPEERAGLLAFLANEAFGVYRHQFQGHPRASRRLSTLSRVVSTLTYILEQMRLLERAGFTEASHVGNIGVVAQSLETYQREVAEVSRAQDALGFDDWVKQLAEAAQRVHDDYKAHFAGKARAGCDPELLRHLCDRLFDVAYQLRPLVHDSPDLKERALLQMTLDSLRLYQREWRAVRDAVEKRRKESQAQGGQEPEVKH
jgi:hypothetical protein